MYCHSIYKYVAKVICAVPPDNIEISLKLFNSFIENIKFDLVKEKYHNLPFCKQKILDYFFVIVKDVKLLLTKFLGIPD